MSFHHKSPQLRTNRNGFPSGYFLRWRNVHQISLRCRFLCLQVMTSSRNHRLTLSTVLFGIAQYNMNDDSLFALMACLNFNSGSPVPLTWVRRFSGIQYRYYLHQVQSWHGKLVCDGFLIKGLCSSSTHQLHVVI